MIFEVVTSIAVAGLAGYSFLKTKGTGTSDADKIQTIFTNADLSIRKGGKTETIRLQRKRKFEGGTEYIYQLPLGLSSKEVIEKKHVLEDGLNVRSNVFEFRFSDLKSLKFDKSIVRQIRGLLKSKRKKKEIDIEFDGMLRIKIYNESMPNLVEWNESLLKPGTWSIPIGYTRNGEIINHDFDKSKHLIVAGATGYGKSVILKLIVTSLICQQPENVELSLIDLKGGSAFHRFKDCMQTKYYSRDPKTAEKVLIEIQKDMNNSFLGVVDNGFEDVKEAGIKKRHFIIIDESADLSDYKNAMDIVTDIARRGRSAGYYLIFCTQYPTAEVIPSQTKRNVIARLCYVVDTDTASRVVLDEGGAEQLPDIPGRGIYKNGPR
ncbi:FtsK/SpoIIIE domain-containing protein [Heyndrickxia ginsengihumi]|uniref:FtsK/SpoIIIE domain-containing protein n=1 Tax=Heyndrickxia ginsengihumi TaxID=363870 RepID=UPI0004AD9279|nr:FtsK/SpoIIIE domain-containing protein [Heyndrickxia ginsengihumi]